MFVVIWEYVVRAESIADFEVLYGTHGGWAALFREYPGYHGTDLLRDEAPGRYLTLDRWRNEADYQAFLHAAKPRYAALDMQGDALTLEERRIGRCTPC